MKKEWKLKKFLQDQKQNPSFSISWPIISM